MNLQELLAEAGYVPAVIRLAAGDGMIRATLLQRSRSRRADALAEVLAGRTPTLDFELSTETIRALAAEGVDCLSWRPNEVRREDEPTVHIPSPFFKEEPAVKIALVGCAKRKLDHAAPARLLYASSTFKMALAWAQDPARGHDRVCVLSAAHGVVELNQALLPYDVTMGDVPDRQAWGARVDDQLDALTAGASVIELVVLAGAAYSIPLRRAVREGWRVVEPLAGMTTGPRRRFLSRGTP